ncbi:MAG: response regulator [Eubacteriales bacterium]|nr:response regulator [Eubacteriales bacterium]
MIVIVADDESFVRRGIIEHISWHSLGIDTVIEARNGLDCLKKAEEFPPDILIADIRMPKLNGIDLGKEIAGRYPHCKMIIISAYSDKEYLKSAISLNVVAYVEKPLVVEELEAAILKALKGIRETLIEQEFSTAHQLFGDILSCKRITQNTKEFLNNPPYLKHIYAVSIVISRKQWLKYRELKQWLVKNTEGKDISVYIYQDMIPHAFLVLMQIPDDRHLPDECFEIYERMIQEMQKEIFVSVGKGAENIDEISYSFKCAKAGMEQHFLKGFGTAIYCGTESWKRQTYEISQEAVSEILNCIRCGRKEDVFLLMDEMWQGLREKGRFYTTESTKQALGILLEQIIRYEKNDTIKELHIWRKIASSETISEIEALYSEVIQHLLPHDTVKDVMVKKMIRIILEEFAEPELSIPYICRKLSVSRSKACLSFKEETGKTINEYITNYRISIAKTYLKEDVSLEEIARCTGFHDSNYFSKIFKKVTGMTPTAYRGQRTDV